MWFDGRDLSPLRGFAHRLTIVLGLTPQALCCRRSATNAVFSQSCVSTIKIGPECIPQVEIQGLRFKPRSSDNIELNSRHSNKLNSCVAAAAYSPRRKPQEDCQKRTRKLRSSDR